MKTLCVLQHPLAETVTDLMRGKPQRATFAAEATVCKYIVPPDYPEKLHQTLTVTIPKAALHAHNVDVYCSCGLDKENRLNVGDERGIAFLAKAADIQTAHERVEAAIQALNGELGHRADIGSRSLIEHKQKEADKCRAT